MRRKIIKKKFLIPFVALFILILTIFIINTPELSVTLQKITRKITCTIPFLQPKYDIIALDENPNYSGIGKEKVEDKDGYTTTFTTTSENQKKYIEYKQNGNASWSQNEYWDGKMEDNGCGITALAIVLSGYGLNYTPEDLRVKYFPVMNYNTFKTELIHTYNIESSPFYWSKSKLSNDSIEAHLKTNKPIIICVSGADKLNRWTISSHYMVLLATDGQGMVYVSNPNGLEETSKSSGWYNLNEVTPYIVKALYINE